PPPHPRDARVRAAAPRPPDRPHGAEGTRATRASRHRDRRVARIRIGHRSDMTTAEPLWGRETERAIANFRISDEPMPAGVIRWLAAVKAAAAAANVELGVLDAEVGAAIEAAARGIIAGDHADQFPVDVFQTGSGT